MKKSITITREEWHTKYHEFINENEDVKQFLMDYFDAMCGSKPSIEMIGKLQDATVAWVCNGYNDFTDCIVCVWCDLDTHGDPNILSETYVWDQERRMSVTVG